MQSSIDTIREVRESDGELVLSSFHAAFAANDPAHARVSRAVWHWKYFGNPAGVRAQIGLDAEGNVLAQYAGLPQRIALDGEWTSITQGVDSFSHPDVRALGKRGAFVRTGEVFAREYGGVLGEGDPWMWGAPIPAAQRVGERFLGYRSFRAQPLLVLRRAPGAGSSQAAGQGRVQSAPLTTFRDEAAAFDALNEERLARGTVCAERSARTLAWRYADHPTRDYQLFVERTDSGDLIGYAVLTRGSVREIGTSLICELVTRARNESALVQAAWHAACEDPRPVLVACHSPYDTAFERYQALGFHAEGSDLFFVGRSYDRAYPFEFWRENWRVSLGDTDLC